MACDIVNVKLPLPYGGSMEKTGLWDREFLGILELRIHRKRFAIHTLKQPLS